MIQLELENLYLEAKNMKKLCLFFFSGTGMTEYVVGKFTNEVERYNAFVDCFKIEEPHTHKKSLSEYDVLGIAYPVHSFNAPKIVIDFVKQLPKSNGMDTFILHTAGEDSTNNYASSDLLTKKLSKRGYRIFNNKMIVMPSNFVTKHSDEKVKGILKKLKEDIPHIASDIIELKPYSMQKYLGSKIIAFVGRIEWLGSCIAGKFFYTKRNCTRCGKCVANCPNKNIIMKKSIGFKWRCGWCMRCIYKCPKNAISVRRPFKFICFDKWYDEKMFK